jgi:hypothetical protein
MNFVKNGNWAGVEKIKVLSFGIRRFSFFDQRNRL